MQISLQAQKYEQNDFNKKILSLEDSGGAIVDFFVG
jgi:hypothetical protein